MYPYIYAYHFLMYRITSIISRKSLLNSYIKFKDRKSWSSSLMAKIGVGGEGEVFVKKEKPMLRNYNTYQISSTLTLVIVKRFKIYDCRIFDILKNNSIRRKNRILNRKLIINFANSQNM